MLSVTLVCPAKAVVWNEVPFGRDTSVVPRNIVLDKGPPVPSPELEIWGSETSSAAYCQINLALVIIIFFVIVFIIIVIVIIIGVIPFEMGQKT